MCATSIGSTFAHRPVIGVRKSGIPDGTEIPAPVRTTAGPDSRISSASRCAPLIAAAFPERPVCALGPSTAVAGLAHLPSPPGTPGLRARSLDRGRRARSLALELRAALLDEGRDALARV